MRAQLSTVGLALALALAASCGGDEDRGDSSAPSAVDAWGLPGGRPGAAAADAARGDSDVVLFVVLDGVSGDELALHGGRVRSTPRIDAVAAGAQVFDDAIAVSTGGNAGIASLLTGRHPREHGIGSLHDLGRATLPGSEATLAEAFQRRGWATIASLSEARHARGLSGFSQGFDVYEAPRLGEAARPADAVALGAREGLERALVAADRGVFAFVAFGDLADLRRREAPHAARAAPFFEARLRPLADRRADIAVQLERMESEPAAAIEELGALLSRARGSDAARAYARALRDAHLADIDAAIGSLLDVIEGAGRAETATVVVCAPRGRAPVSGESRVGPRFVPSVLEVPMIVRWPYGGSAGRVHPTSSVLGVVRALDDAFALELRPSRFPAAGVSYVASAGFTSHAAVLGDDQLERYGLDDSTLAFERATGAQNVGWSVEDPANAPFRAFTEPATLVITRAAGAAPVRVAWRASDGRTALVGAEDGSAVGRAKRHRISGSSQVGDPSGGELEIALERRATSVRLDLDADAGRIAPADIAIGSALLSDLPMLYVPSSDSGAPVAAGELGLVDLKRDQGIWWRLAVGGEGPVEMLVGTWPPRSPDEAMEIVAGGPVIRHDVPGRDDLARFVGTAPFDLRIKKGGKEEFAIACRHGGRFLSPDEMVTDQLRFGSSTSISVLVPSWQPAITEALGDVSGPLYASDTADAPITVRRTEVGPVRGADGALDTDALLFLKALPSGE